MKRWNIIPLALMAVLSPQVIAEINLTVPSQVTLEVINGAEAKQQKAITLKDGKNQIAFQYEGNYRNGGEITYFNTDIILMTFDGENQDYTLSLPRLDSDKQVAQFNKQPALTLTDSNDNPVPFEQGKLMKNGIQFNRDLVAEMRVYNQTEQPASLNQVASIIIPENGQTEGEVAGKMLDYWYSKADQKTRDQFKARINQSN